MNVIKQYVTDTGMTYRELAMEIGMTKQALWALNRAIEKGKTKKTDRIEAQIRQLREIDRLKKAVDSMRKTLDFERTEIIGQESTSFRDM
jgi:DNA-binding XRE family transcriptional regulator